MRLLDLFKKKVKEDIWINVSSELPPLGENVQVKFNDSDAIKVLHRYKDFWCTKIGNYWSSGSDIIAWKKLNE